MELNGTLQCLLSGVSRDRELTTSRDTKLAETSRESVLRMSQMYSSAPSFHWSLF